MSILSTEEFQRKGFQIDLDMVNLDSLISLDDKKGLVPAGKKQTWDALKSEWDHFFQKHIKNTPILPWQDSTDLDQWLSRREQWMRDAQLWAMKGDSQTRSVAAALPDSPAVIEHRENPPSQGIPLWGWMIFGVAMTTAVGYTIASTARLGGR